MIPHPTHPCPAPRAAVAATHREAQVYQHLRVRWRMLLGFNHFPLREGRSSRGGYHSAVQQWRSCGKACGLT